MPGCIFGALKWTQAKDVAQGAPLAMEKGLDGHSDASVCQCDVRRYFDSLPLLRICIFLENEGVPVSLLAAILRHQFLTRIILMYRSVSRLLPSRSKGGLTGSNVALTMARVPIELTAAELYETCALKGFDIGIARLVFATYVDNVFSVANSATDAYENLRDFFRHLASRWELSLKDNSVSLLASKGHDFSEFVPEANVPVRETVEILGWIVHNTGSIGPQWSTAVRQAWGIFYT